VFGDDRVTCHTGAYVIPGEDGDAKRRSRGNSYWDLILELVLNKLCNFLLSCVSWLSNL